ncbi:hypothetical protein [Sorangium sp. So ce117]|uniref:hypothetical protein n=1 Tax=Sorangium sp. So ce117 TaxID=3133277 RepID=UPI003F5E6321
MIFYDNNGNTIIEVDDSTTRLEFPRLEQEVVCVNLAEGVRSLRSLKTLLYGMSRRNDVHELNFLNGLTHITEIGVAPLLFGQDVTPISTCTGLRSIRLISMTNVDVRPLASLPDVEDLHLDGKAKGMTSLRKLERLKKLAVTSMKGVSVDIFRGNQALELLSLVGSSFRDVPSFPQLRELDIRSTNITSIIDIGQQPSLRIIHMDRCNKLRSLEGLEQFKQLEEINLGEIRELPSLEPICSLPKVRVIRLERTRIAEQKLRAKVPPTLELVISSGENLDLVTQIARQAPSCRIELTGGSEPCQLVGLVKIQRAREGDREGFRIEQDLADLMNVDTNDDVEELVRDRAAQVAKLDDVDFDSESSYFVATTKSLESCRRLAQLINELIERRSAPKMRAK